MLGLAEHFLHILLIGPGSDAHRALGIADIKLSHVGGTTAHLTKQYALKLGFVGPLQNDLAIFAKDDFFHCFISIIDSFL
jgi:hypothetical protein